MEVEQINALGQLVEQKIDEAVKLQKLALNREMKNHSMDRKSQSFRGSIFTH